jgi:hypothetical protein
MPSAGRVSSRAIAQQQRGGPGRCWPAAAQRSSSSASSSGKYAHRAGPPTGARYGRAVDTGGSTGAARIAPRGWRSSGKCLRHRRVGHHHRAAESAIVAANKSVTSAHCGGDSNADVRAKPGLSSCSASFRHSSGAGTDSSGGIGPLLSAPGWSSPSEVPGWTAPASTLICVLRFSAPSLNATEWSSPPATRTQTPAGGCRCSAKDVGHPVPAAAGPSDDQAQWDVRGARLCSSQEVVGGDAQFRVATSRFVSKGRECTFSRRSPAPPSIDR